MIPYRSLGSSRCQKNMLFCRKCVNKFWFPWSWNWPLWCIKHFCRVSLHYYMQYVLDKLWKPCHDLYFRDLKENMQTWAIWSKFLFRSCESSILNKMTSLGRNVFKKNKCKHIQSERPPAKVNGWPWPLKYIKVHVLIWLSASTNYRLQHFQKNASFYLFPFKSLRNRIWPCCKMCYGQSKVILWAKSVVPKYIMDLMLIHTSFKDIGPLVPVSHFYHIWVWWPSWSCDLDHFNIYLSCAG